MVKNLLTTLILGTFLSSCAIQKQKQKVVEKAKSYIGTPYRYGGNTPNGIDCSGLVCNSFGAIGISMPRVSREQAEFFKEVKFSNLKAGDLLFFDTGGNYINHVGIVVSQSPNKVEFIHASTSKGVRIDNLLTNYWAIRFIKVTRPTFKNYEKK